MVHYDAVVISPHLDDAVFSCGGTIAKLIANGKTVLVLNVFTEFPAHDVRGPVDLSDQRYEEERKAASRLGFESVNLDQIDAVLRRKAYQSPAGLFGDPTEADRRYIDELSTIFQSRLADVAYSQLYLPLAIGWHVDHTLCFLALEDFETAAEVLYYEDAPYCLWPSTTRHRLAELGAVNGAEPSDQTLRARGFVREWLSLSRCWAELPPMVNFKPRFARPFATGVVSGYFVKLLYRHRRRAQPYNGRLTPVSVDISATWPAKLAACYCYESQMKEFFLSRADAEQRYHRYSEGTAASREIGSAWFERFWRKNGRAESGHYTSEVRAP